MKGGDGGVPGRGEQPDPTSLRYEELVAALEELVRRMADGEVGIEEATDLYLQARELHRLASERLEAVARRIENLEPDQGEG